MSKKTLPLLTVMIIEHDEGVFLKLAPQSPILMMTPPTQTLLVTALMTINSPVKNFQMTSNLMNLLKIKTK